MAAQDAPIGSSLIGELEGPIVLVDAPRPENLKQAPMLDALVEDGTLPPVEERVPLEPLVVQPLEGIGTYGGTLRRGFTGPGDDENGNRYVSGDKLVFWDYTGTEFRPALARSWEFSDEDRVFTIKLREGHKWSDGAPFTADDFVFWYEDIYINPDLVPTPHSSFAINGKQGRIEKVDETTVSFIFEEPYPLFLTILGGTTFMGSGHMTNRGFHGGSYAPAHYLKQFHPKYTAQAEIDAMASEENVEDWIALFRLKNQWSLNPELPVLGPWRTVSPVNTPNWTMERNPFYYEVDPEGNQLPYLDGIQMTLAENLEVLNLRAIAGEYDLQERHTDIAKLPVFLENMEQGDYSVHLDPGAYGSDATLQINHSYDADPEIAKWLHNADFRRALSMGIDRDQLNETFWLGVGSPGSVGAGAGRAAEPRRRVAHQVGDARRRAGQPASRRDRADREGRRGLPHAERRQRPPAPGGLRHLRRVRALPAHRPVDRPAMAGDRYPARRLRAGAQPGHDPHAQQRAPDLHVGQRRLGADLRLPAPRVADRPGRGDDGSADRQLVRDQRRRGHGADRGGHARGDRSLQIGRRPEHGGEQHDRPGDLEDHRR